MTRIRAATAVKPATPFSRTIAPDGLTPPFPAGFEAGVRAGAEGPRT
jgi:hypothetical protein